MSRRRRPPIPVTLVLPAKPPTPDEIDAILKAADSIVDRAGRSGLTLILHGSRSKKVTEQEWDKLADYGALKHLIANQVGRKIDWCIHRDWLRFEHTRDGIPLLYHSEKGWERVQQLWVKWLLGWFEEWQRAEEPERVWPRMETIHRDIKFLLLEAIERQQRRDLTPSVAGMVLARDARRTPGDQPRAAKPGVCGAAASGAAFDLTPRPLPSQGRGRETPLPAPGRGWGRGLDTPTDVGVVMW